MDFHINIWVNFLVILVCVSDAWFHPWGPWMPWSECTCGVYESTRSRTRQHGSQDEVQTEVCERCKNGGTWQAAGCHCGDRYYGTCCESRVSICDAVPADVVFVLDSSLSQTEEQFNKQLNFVARFIHAVNISATEFQFAVVTFSTEAVTELDFDISLSKEELKTQIKNITFRPGATFTDKGLDLARTLLSTRTNRLEGLTIVKFAFVLTDGMSTSIRATEEAASNLRRVTFVVAIGIGREVLHAELQSIASPPDSYSLSYVYSVENFDALNTLIDRLIDATCEKCAVSYMADIFVVIDDMSESAMTQEEFRMALNGLTYITQHLSAYGQPNGQTVNITTVGDLGYRYTSLSDANDLDTLLLSVQSIRQQESACYTNECGTTDTLNISSVMKETINRITDQNMDNRNGSRKMLLVFSSGRFKDKSKVSSELHDVLKESDLDIFAIGAGYDTDMEGLHAIVREPYNVFSLLDDNLETLDVLKSKMSYILCS